MASKSRSSFAKEQKIGVRSPSSTTPCLPYETLHEIALYLPCHALKCLLPFQPHPVGRIASDLFFSTLSLHFGVRDSDRYASFPNWGRANGMDASIEWHDKRSYDILTTIVKNDNFAKKVRTLKVYSPGSRDTDALIFQTGLLNLALPKMTGLKVLECYGLILPLRPTISKLPETVPLLRSMRLGDRVNHQIISSHGDLRIHRLSHLDQLRLCDGWEYHVSLTDIAKDLQASSIKKLHITCPATTPYVLAQCTTPALISVLTHLSLRTSSTESAFEIALRYGVNLRSLRIQGFPNSLNSKYFRCYAHALPSLTEFGIFLYDDTRPLTDIDFFPAVCDFLRPKSAQLVHLELRAPEPKVEQDRLGFNGGKECWALFKDASQSFPKLESLSMTLPDGKKSFSFHYSKLIPKGVTRLTLYGYQLIDSSIKNIFRVSRTRKGGPSWPPNLRLVGLIVGLTNNIARVRMVAECIVTVQVVEILDKRCKDIELWSVSRDVTSRDVNAGNSWESMPMLVSCKQWSIREATAIWAEMLDRHDCEDTWIEDCLL